MGRYNMNPRKMLAAEMLHRTCNQTRLYARTRTALAQALCLHPPTPTISK